MPQPTGLTAAWSGSDIVASWDAITPPSGVTDVEYLVRAIQGNDQAWSSTVTATSETLTGLDDTLPYSIRVRSVDAATGAISLATSTFVAAQSLPPVPNVAVLTVSGQQSTDSLNHAFSIPSETQEGDIIVVLAFVGPRSNTLEKLVTRPPGWTMLPSDDTAFFFTERAPINWRAEVLVSRAGSSPPTSVVMSTAVASDVYFHVYRLRGSALAFLLAALDADSNRSSAVSSVDTIGFLPRPLLGGLAGATVVQFGAFALPAGSQLVNPPSLVTPFSRSATLNGNPAETFSYMQLRTLPVTDDRITFPFSPAVDSVEVSTSGGGTEFDLQLRALHGYVSI